MNILLIRPKPHKRTINLQSFMICEPLELEYLSAIAKKMNHNVEVIDMIIEKKNLTSFLKKKAYDIVGITAYLPHVNIVNSYAEEVKRYNNEITVIVGGVVAEVQGHVFDRKVIDYIIEQKPLETFEEILSHHGNKEYLNKLEGILKDKPNLNRVIEIPTLFPDRLITKRYRKHYNYVFHQECATIKTSYGCPYNCSFCYCNVLACGKYLARDIDDVIEEIKTIQEDRMFIVDDNFLHNPKRLRRFCELMRENKINKEFIAFGRTDFIRKNEDILIQLREVGLRAVFIGLESFRQGELEDMMKRNTVENNIQAIKLLDRLNIECYKGVIVQYDWDKSDFKNLVDHLLQFKNSFANIQPLTPMYGTESYRKMESKISIESGDYHLQDMAHLVMKPTKLSKRMFYYQILKSYLVLMLKQKTRKYILQTYGRKVYRRVRKGVVKIVLQYFRLIIEN